MDDQRSGAERTVVTGTVLNDRYRLATHIGQGAMGDVFEAYDSKLDRHVAVKILKGSLVNDSVLRARFEREARAAGKLSHHPNVITVFDVDEVHSQPFIVMELASGGTLSSILSAGVLPIDRAISIAQQILGALSVAHANGIIHRDIKPSNILFGAGGEVKVTDFGIATLYGTASVQELTLSNQVIGTPSYLSPERADGKPVSPSSDIFSVGVLLFEMVTGERPFKGDSPIAIVLAARSGTFDPPESLRSDMPPALAKVIKRSLSPAPETRYSSAAHMAAALDFNARLEETAPLLEDEEAQRTQVMAMPVADAKAPTEVVNRSWLLSGRIQVLGMLAVISAVGARTWRIVSSKANALWKKVSNGQPHPTLLFFSAALIAFLAVFFLAFHGGANPHSKKRPTTSVAPTTVASTTTTLPVTSTTGVPAQPGPAQSPTPPIAPPGHGKKGH